MTLQPVEVRGAGSPAFGLSVVELEGGGVAHLSGVQVGDVILQLNGKMLQSPEQLSDAVQVAAHTLSIGVLRGGRLKVCEVTLPRESVAEVA